MAAIKANYQSRYTLGKRAAAAIAPGKSSRHIHDARV